MRDFAAIDFETANRRMSSICSVGIVIVADGKVRETVYRLVRPNPNYYLEFHTGIHGLTREETNPAPHFPQVWEEIAPVIDGRPLVAHNSPFDEGCLKAAYETYKMEYPGYIFHCTCRASRRLFPFLPNHRLNTVAAHCGFDLVNHHHALADAEACAAIALKVFSAGHDEVVPDQSLKQNEPGMMPARNSSSTLPSTEYR